MEGKNLGGYAPSRVQFSHHHGNPRLSVGLQSSNELPTCQTHSHTR